MAVTREFPATRMRRLRTDDWARRLVQENGLSVRGRALNAGRGEKVD
jgi:delta-aminolevulinic acid dehydratase/porphobilinogen synthase